MTKPLLIFPIADPHVGSIYGMHPNYIKRGNEWITVDEAGGWYYKNNPHYYLNSKQVRMWRHYEKAVKTAALLRASKDCDLFVIVMGDAVDGDHHATHQLTTKNEPEQMMAHVSMMEWTLEQLNFNRSRDKLAYIEGTESHTRDNEEVIAQMLPAERFKDGSACTPFIEMDIQGKLFWFYHHGVAAGFSYSIGAGLYNYVKQIYIDYKMNDKRPPDFVMTADKHKIDHQTYRHNGNEIHGLILPPLQDKTRFTNKLPRAIVHATKVGFSPVLVEDGKVNVLSPYLLEMPLNEVLVW